MNKKLTLIGALLGMCIYTSAALKVEKADPGFWWTGMHNPELQIMLYGPDIAFADAAVNYPGVKITRQVKVESPNYLFLYLDIAPTAKPGKMQIRLKSGKDTQNVAFELKARDENAAQQGGFSSEDALYLIMPDRFSDGNPGNNENKSLKYNVKVDRQDPNARHGGDIQGIDNHLDYLADLGVTAIWLNPVLENDMPGGSYHGYATTDYYKVDRRFGSNEDYRRLVENSHKKGMKVVMDMIFNHCGSNHIWFTDRPSRDWFNFSDGYVQTSYRLSPLFDPYTSDYDKKLTTDGWFVETMPDLNQSNEHLMKYLIQNSIFWIEYSKIDGIRMDTYPYAFFGPMAQWCQAVKAEYPNYNIVGESWYEVEGGTAWWQQNSRLHQQENSYLPVVMDFPLMLASRKAFSEQTDSWNGLNRIYNQLAMDYMYADANNVMFFLDNHDTDRFLPEMPKDLGIFKQALTFLLTTRGIPQIYYGTEILMNGSKEKSDGYVRKDFPGGFPADKVNNFYPNGRTTLQNEAVDFLRTLLNWRKGNKTISQGSLKHFMPTNGAYAYLREGDGKRYFIIMNGCDEAFSVNTKPYQEALKGATSGKDILSGSTITWNENLMLPGRAVYIIEL